MNKINWENLPSKKTPINAENLNTMQDNIENEIEPVVLFNTSTTTGGTLFDSITNYKRLKIFYTDTDGFRNSIEIYNNNEQTIACGISNINNNGTIYLKSARVSINGTTLTIDRQYQSTLKTTPQIQITAISNITIYRIEGYNY